MPYRELPGGADFARNMALIVEGRRLAKFSAGTWAGSWPPPSPWAALRRLPRPAWT
ncbi:hypothetical protein DFAR_1180014 [Desulfarculales bacterium]